jgi:peptidoglycan/xylan/chitin deacetylase (PgdA/CDA1 family)
MKKVSGGKRINQRASVQPLLVALAAMLLAAIVAGCAGPKASSPTAPQAITPAPAGMPSPKTPARPSAERGVRVFPEFVAVIARQGDTLSSLASEYLKDASKDWMIAEFNGVQTLSEGQPLIIPLKPFHRGGLSRREYQTVPVLSYHNFSTTKKSRMSVTAESFEQQMKYLKDNGYRVITLDQLMGFLNFEDQIPKKSVVITIDDGWRAVYEIAFPILKKYGYPATLFIYTDLITGSTRTLSWEMIQEMFQHGIDVQAHTQTHRNLTMREKKESPKSYFETIQKELTVSNGIIKNRLNKEAKYFAYTYSDTNSLVIELLKKNGYSAAFTVSRGPNPFFTEPYRINRSMIYGDFDIIQFEKNLITVSNEALK